MSHEPTEEGLEGQPEKDSFGPWLRRQREIREIELREISERTKIGMRYLKAMEQDRFDLLPGEVFAKGFLREYARYVGLDPDEVVNFYLSATKEPEGEPEELEPVEAAPGSSRRGLYLMLVVVVLLALAALTFFAVSWLTSERPPPERAPVEETAPSTPVPQPAEPPPETVAAPPQTPAPAELPLRVTVDFSEDCWVEVTVDGSERIAQRFVQGESLQLAARQQVVFETLGNAGGVTIQVNGHPFELGAGPGRVVRNLTIDLETAERLRTDSP